MFCLALSGFFDMFDGKVARRKTDRTDDEKLFGIQLDSLCDVVAFGAFPAFLCYCMGVTGRIGFLAIAFYSVSGVIRLAYFNVLETNHFFSEEEEYEKVYYGLPITSIAIILPILFVIHMFVGTQIFSLVLTIMLFTVGMLFIANFKLRKPSNKVLLLICLLVAAAAAPFLRAGCRGAVARRPVYDLESEAVIWIARIGQVAASKAEKGRIASCRDCTGRVSAEPVSKF